MTALFESSQPIVRPVCTPRTPKLGRSAFMAASQEDLRALQSRLDLPNSRALYMSRLFFNAGDRTAPALIGPVMGAPYAALLLEILHAWGVDELIFFGWCGSIDPGFRTGDLVVPDDALIDEGTSLHYEKETGGISEPDGGLKAMLIGALEEKKLSYLCGRVWTTDGLFRETQAKMTAFQQRQARVVEMELSALFSVGRFHAMRIASVLAVSDELYTKHWKPGFKDERFKKTRADLVDVLSAFCRKKQSCA